MIIKYELCNKIEITLDENSISEKLHDVVIDEISLCDSFIDVVHEIRFLNGNLSIKCKDLKAEWIDF